MDLARYWPMTADVAFQDFLTRMKAGDARAADYPFLTFEQFKAFKLALSAKEYLPSIPLVTVPQPIEAELVPLNSPGENALVIVSGNNSFTFEVLATIWAQGITPAYLMLVDCLGNTVDMAMVYGTFTPENLGQALKKCGLEKTVKHRHLIVPGWTSPMAGHFAGLTNWEVEVGPICGAELPLFLGDRWKFPENLHG